MSLEYIEIDDPAYKATCGKRQPVLIRSTDYSRVPVTLPNWEPEPCCLNWRFHKIGQQIKDMEVHPDDVWLITYPKSGSTWCQEMVWLICNDLDYSRAASNSILQRFSLMEFEALTDLPEEEDRFQQTVSMPSPRFIKTHLPVALMPDQIWSVKPRILYVRRNPKSVAVSYYYYYVSFKGYKGTIDDFLEAFMKDLKYCSPYHRHVIEYHNLDYQGNILYLCYEDMKKDLKSELKRVCAFFNKSYSNEQLDTLADHLSFDKIKNNRSVNLTARLESVLKETNRTDKLNDENFQFVRKGKADGWKSELTAEQQQQLDEWTKRKVSNPEHLKLFH